jgi:hypothetical protein
MPGSPIFAIFVYGPFIEAHVILWLAILSYTAHSFLVVVQETAAGNDTVSWPSEPWSDRLGDFCYLAGLLTLWLLPAYCLVWFLEQPGWLFALWAIGVLWLIFPVSVLSSLSAASRWVMLRPAVIWRLRKRFPSWLGFYAASGLVLLVCLGLYGTAVSYSKVTLPPVTAVGTKGWLMDLSLVLGQIFFLPVAAVGAAAGMLVYARLLGRLGWLISKDRAPEGDVPPEATKLPVLRPAAVGDSSQSASMDSASTCETLLRPPEVLPQGQRQGLAGPPSPDTDETYEVLAEEHWLRPVPEAPRLPHVLPPAFAALPPEPRSQRKAALAMRSTRISELEDRLARPSPLPRPPRRPLVSGVYRFPFYRSNVRPLIWLSLGNLVVGVVLYVTVSLFF